ncbi:MAG TPA: UDP binding domain-containing protein, partial [Flavobacterium sp.]|nr:UDP binding domain-containing protein [Flavobacterium sp.]
ASQVVKLMIKKGVTINGAKLLMLGITFKENCPDVRNTKIVDVVHALADYGIQVTIFDPWAKPAEVEHEYQLKTTNDLPTETFDAIVLGVAHNEFTTIDLSKLKKENGVLFDVKGVLKEKADGRL